MIDLANWTFYTQIDTNIINTTANKKYNVYRG